MAYEKLNAAYEGNTVAPNVFPATNSMMPEMNWHTPPKNISTPTRTLGVVTPRALTPKIEIRKMPVAKDSKPNGAGLASRLWTTGREGCSVLAT